MSIRVLIVEDESIVVKDIRDRLKSLGYKLAAEVTSGEAAVQKAADTQPDLVLMDIGLKGKIDGVEAARRIQTRFDIPVVYLTAYTDDATLQRAKITSPFGYILKPFEERDLHTTIEMALHKHKLERQLKESERWLATTLSSIGDAVIATDEKGKVVFMNPVAEELTGWTQEDALGMDLPGVFKIVEEKTGIPAENPVTRVSSLDMTSTWGNHTLLITRDGREIPVDKNAAPIRDDKGDITGVVVVFRDITERRQSEEQLRKLSRAVEQSPASIIITDTAGTIEYVNPKFSEVTGYTFEEVIGKNSRILKSGEMEPEAYVQLWETITAGGEWRGEFHNKKKNGELYWETATISPVADENGAITHFLAVKEDITEKKQAEAELAWEAGINAAVAELSRALMSPASLEEISSLVLEHARHLTGSEFGYVGYINQETGALVSPTLTVDIWDACQVPDKEIVFHSFAGLWGWVLDNRKSILTNSPSDDPWSSGVPEGHVPIHQLVCVPALFGETLVGQVALANPGRDYTHQDLVLVERLAVLYALAVQRRRAEEEIEQLNQELEHRVSERTAQLMTANEELRHEIAVRRRATDALHDSEMRYRRTVETAEEGIWMDDAEFKTVFVNQKMAEMLGYTIEEMIDQPILAFVNQESHAAIKEQHQRRRRGLRDQFVLMLRRKDGKNLWALVNASPNLGKDDRYTGSLLMVTDITERIMAEKALQEERALLAQRVEERTAELSAANAELSRAVRIKDEFLATMSHELRSPLYAILSLSEILEEGIYGQLNEQQRKSLRNIVESGQHLLTLINDILDISKIEAGKLTLEVRRVWVADVCHASLRMVREQASKKGISISNDFDDRVTTVQADERFLKQMLVNLLTNAVKFTPEGGDMGLEVASDSESNAVHFTVWDTGVGIASEDLPKLFEPFVQLDSSLSRQYTGSGLGLALVRRMAEMHGGSVEVKSDPGRGSRFKITLPWSGQEERTAVRKDTGEMVADEALGERELNGLHAAEPSPDAPMILLAEDSEMVISTLTDYLQTKGYRVIVARDGRETIKCAREMHPQLILMDIQMPSMDGLEATRRIRADADLAHISIIALSALAMPGDRERCLEAGADDYLSKPVSLRKITETISSYLPMGVKSYQE